MNADELFYFTHASVRIDGGYRAFMYRGQVRVFGEYSLAESFNPQAIRAAAIALGN